MENLWKFLTTGHLVHLRPCAAAGHFVTFKSQMLKYRTTLSECYALSVSRAPGGLKLFTDNRKITNDFSALLFGWFNSLKREITGEATLKNIEKSRITQSTNTSPTNRKCWQKHKTISFHDFAIKTQISSLELAGIELKE